MSDLRTALAMAEEEVRKAQANVNRLEDECRKAVLHLNHVRLIRDAIEDQIEKGE